MSIHSKPLSLPLPVRLPKTFRELPNAGSDATYGKLPNKLPASFRNLPELQQNQKATNKLPDKLPESFRKLPELWLFECLLTEHI